MPSLREATIIKGRTEYGGAGCASRKKAAGREVQRRSPEIESQEAGRVPNPDVCDLVNTIQKMAQKRAFVAATLLCREREEFFTQDVEDIEDRTATPGRPYPNQASTTNPPPRPPHSGAVEREISRREGARRGAAPRIASRKKARRTRHILQRDVREENSRPEARDRRPLSRLLRPPDAAPQPAAQQAAEVIEGEIVEGEIVEVEPSLRA